MFFSAFKKTKSQNPESLTPASPAPVEEAKPPADAETEVEIESHHEDASTPEGTILGRLFHKQEEEAGPETSYEDEAWAPEAYVGLFHKKRAVAEEQLSSTPAAQ